MLGSGDRAGLRVVDGDLHAPPIAAPPAGLYVHVPFCVSVCPYCDFVVRGGGAARGPRSLVPRFLRAIEAELGLRAHGLDDRWGPPGDGRPGDGRPPLDTVYLGGGTPSLLPAPAIGTLIALIAERYGLASDAEITLEADPAPDERGEAEALVDAGVTRVSLGAQSLDAGGLRRLGRRHSPDDIAAAVRSYRRAGVGSVGLDLLYDVPGQTDDSWDATVDAALALEPDHLSLYALALDDPQVEGLTGRLGDHLPPSAGARRWRERARRGQDEDRAAGMYLRATARLAAAGFRAYEISNLARAGHESRHDLGYWTRRPHEAIGPGAHAFDGMVRRWNAAAIEAWLDALDPPDGSAPSLPPGAAEPLDAAGAAIERLILGLRLDTGVPAAWAAEPPLRDVATWATGERLAEIAGDRLRLTPRGWLLSNEVLARLV
ncbi:MAG TPA: coproporphyrinogen-III oxidase family protein [Candidatus Dormibacteraeota bacterium]|nr:coproporphyrinogen-III oxidase family protein [Candidatus Dormibacteraeota bacterium]